MQISRLSYYIDQLRLNTQDGVDRVLRNDMFDISDMQSPIVFKNEASHLEAPDFFLNP